MCLTGKYCKQHITQLLEKFFKLTQLLILQLYFCHIAKTFSMV